MKSRVSTRYIALIAALCLLSVSMSGCLNINQSGYEFKSGITPPAVVSNLMQNGPVILFITQNNCPDCEQARPLIAGLQSQYNGTNVTFVNFNIDNNSTSKNVAQVWRDRNPNNRCVTEGRERRDLRGCLRPEHGEKRH